MRRLCSMAGAGAGALLAAALAAAGDPKTERFELSNGLDVIIRPIEGGGPVALLVLFDIGEAHDPPGRSGLGHLIEHLYVTAAAGARPASTAQEWMERYQAQVNAQTGRLYTLIAAVFDPGDLEIELQDAAARMTALEVEQADLDRELPRLEAELANMYGGIPTLGAQNLAADAAAPLAEGARRGGSMEQIRSATLPEIHDRLERLYKPANARLVLAGGLDPATARERVEAAFGPVKPGEPVAAPRAAAPARTGAIETVSVPRPGFGEFPDGLAAVAWRVPPPGSPDFAPFMVMYGRLLEELDPMARPAVPPIIYAPLDRPEVLILSAEIAAGADAAGTVAAIRARAAEAASPDREPVTAGLAAEQLGPMLGFSEFPDFRISQYPYGMAFVVGRRAQLAIDPARLEAELIAVDADDMRRFVEGWLGPGPGSGAAVVVRVGP